MTSLLERILPHLLVAWFGATAILAAIVGVIYRAGMMNGDGYASVYVPTLPLYFLGLLAFWMVAMEGAAFLIRVFAPVHTKSEVDP